MSVGTETSYPGNTRIHSQSGTNEIIFLGMAPWLECLMSNAISVCRYRRTKFRRYDRSKEELGEKVSVGGFVASDLQISFRTLN